MVDKKFQNECSGCSACAEICPVHCIKMTSDKQGFLYPEIDHNLCINCGACDRVCESATFRNVEETVPLAYAAYARDSQLRMQSSSGGFFSLAAEKCLEENGVVVGASMSPDCYHVEHTFVTNKESLQALRGSKYLQSHSEGVFHKIKSLLEEGTQVLFSGTPCQVDGLKAYLGRDYDNLLCIDFICHGVPSEKTWKKYCDEIEEKSGRKIASVNFRHKKYSWENITNPSLNKTGELIYKSRNEEPFLRLFLANYGLRPSCYECRHKGINRKSDITMADFWGIGNVLPAFSDGRGVSLILAHSSKGEKAISDLNDRLIVQAINGCRAIDYNTSCLESAYKPEKVGSFWKGIDDKTIQELADIYAPVSKKTRIKNAITRTGLYGKYRQFNTQASNAFW